MSSANPPNPNPQNPNPHPPTQSPQASPVTKASPSYARLKWLLYLALLLGAIAWFGETAYEKWGAYSTSSSSRTSIRVTSPYKRDVRVSPAGNQVAINLAAGEQSRVRFKMPFHIVRVKSGQCIFYHTDHNENLLEFEFPTDSGIWTTSYAQTPASSTSRYLVNFGYIIVSAPPEPEDPAEPKVGCRVLMQFTPPSS